MRSGTLSESLGIDASEYDRIKSVEEPNQFWQSKCEIVRLRARIKCVHVSLERPRGYEHDRIPDVHA